MVLGLKCLISAELLIGSRFLVKLKAQEVQLDPILATVVVSGYKNNLMMKSNMEIKIQTQNQKNY